MLDAHSGMCFPQLTDAAFKDCPKLPAGKERPQVPGFRSSKRTAGATDLQELTQVLAI